MRVPCIVSRRVAAQKYVVIEANIASFWAPLVCGGATRSLLTSSELATT